MTNTNSITVDAMTVVKPSGVHRYYLDGKRVAKSTYQRMQSARISADCFITTSLRGVFKHRASWRIAAPSTLTTNQAGV